MALKLIADVSSYNNVVNWKLMKERGVTGGIAKIIRKDLTKDNQFDNNYKALHGNKMPWGVYNYSYATTAAKAMSDMKLICDILDTLDLTYFKYGVWFDIEDVCQASLSKSTIASIINAAQEVVEERGYTFGVYTGMSYYKEHMQGASINCKNWWIARYYLGYTSMSISKQPDSDYKPAVVSDLVAWQYSSSVNISGIASGNGGMCDMSVLYKEPTAPNTVKTVTTVSTKSTVVNVGSARIDENGNIHGGKAGDQTGREVCTENWYLHSKGWVVIRPKDASVAEKIATAMQSACDNSYIGYDQYQRNTLYNIAQNVGFNPAKVTTACETDCSALVRVCCAYAGIKVNDFNTTSERNVLESTGKFTVLTDTKYTMSADYLKRGDILVTKTQGHTVVVLNDGAKAESNSTTNTTAAVKESSTKAISPSETYTGTYPALPPRGYYQYGDGITTYKNYPTQIKRVQALMNWIFDGNIAEDGQYGKQTVDAVNKFKKLSGLKEDGCFNQSTLTAAKNYKKSASASSTSGSQLSKTAQFTGTCTATMLNVRSWAGTENDNIKAVPYLTKGQKVSVCDTVNDSSGSPWYYVCINKKYYGFVSAKYISK